MKKQFTINKKQRNYFLFEKLKLLFIYLGFVFPAIIIAQPSSMPNGSLYFDEYTVEDQSYFLIPNSTSSELMTEWDWIEMESQLEIRKHTKILSSDLQRTEKIEIIETNMLESWEHEIDYILIDQEKTVVYNKDEEIISSLPHSNYFLASNDSLDQAILNNGLKPKIPFPEYSQLSTEIIEEYQQEGYTITETTDGYIIANNLEELIINVGDQSRTYRLLSDEYDIPYYDFRTYNINSQGYLVPSIKEIKTRLLSEKGHCIIKVERQAYRDYELYYDPAIVYEDENEEEEGISSDFNLYPNPTEANIEIEYIGNTYNSTSYSISISNQQGEPVHSQNALLTSKIELINLSNLPQGFYIIQFTIDGKYFNKSLLKN